jgi:heme a synthase
MFGLIVLGSVVRTTGSGLACPDWPLCQGRLLPPLEFHVLIEWSHRAVALLVSVFLLATVTWVFLRRELRSRFGGLAALALGLLVLQILLGALTVWKLLHPSVVNTHLAVALLLFGSMVTLVSSAGFHAEKIEGFASGASRPPALLPLMAVVTTLTYVQTVIGGTVSSQHAGLACPDWPACNGAWLPPLATLAGIQMLHRYVAYLLVAVMVIAVLASRSMQDGGVRAGAKLALSLTAAQIVLGVCNVLLGTPPWLTALHIATAAAILAATVAVTCRVARLSVREAAGSSVVAAPAELSNPQVSR